MQHTVLTEVRCSDGALLIAACADVPGKQMFTVAWVERPYGKEWGLVSKRPQHDEWMFQTHWELVEEERNVRARSL